LECIKIGSRIVPGTPQRMGRKKLDILPDMPDVRDRIYTPTLGALAPKLALKVPATLVRDQGEDQSCTGYSLAHIIDLLRAAIPGSGRRQPVSARMLYEMAKRNDEWSGTAYDGSSLRGAIKGFFRNGVCSEKTAPDKFARVPKRKGQEWTLTYEMAKEARDIRLGAYFRVQPDISDYHAALNEARMIYVSAQIHTNWMKPVAGRITPGGRAVGGHAFVIVGYDEKGFLVLNSWGPGWGRKGVAHWEYQDWAATVMDAWVLQLGVKAPEAFGAVPRGASAGTSGLFGFGDPSRNDILGHFVNIDDGRYIIDGKYGSPTAAEMQETVDRLTSPDANGKKGYDHLVIYAHGGLNSLADDARRIATWKRTEIFARNRLYNFHLMWGSGFFDEVFGEISKSAAAGRVGGLFDSLFDAGLGKKAGSYAWSNMKQDAQVAFDGSTDFDGGFKSLQPLIGGLNQARRRPKLHLIGHSAGSIVLGHLLSALGRFPNAELDLGSIHLMAPACTVAFFRQHFGPYLSGAGAKALTDKIYLYNLSDELEVNDTVGPDGPLSFLLPSYSHSLLYLVSRAYEIAAKTPLAGMQVYVDKMPSGAKLKIDYSASSVTASTKHGGFDNDVATLSTIMSRILGKPVPLPPTANEVVGY
jgi:hypothetical protein